MSSQVRGNCACLAMTREVTILHPKELLFKPELKRVGNLGGLRLLDRLDRLEERQVDIQTELQNQRLEFDKQRSLYKKTEDELKRQRDLLEPFRLQILSIRATELEKLSPHFDSEARFQRNAMVHGGNVRVDLQALDYLEACREFARLQNAKMGFQSLYGRPVDELRFKIADAPQEIVGILNRRATLETMHKWKLVAKEERLAWIALCDRLIGTWSQSAYEVARSSSDAHKEAIKAEYDQLCQWMSDKTEILKQRRNK
ncbi:hypothetical protein TMatcc_002218 [Talaromyces marneffei ATCC 18224]